MSNKVNLTSCDGIALSYILLPPFFLQYLHYRLTIIYQKVLKKLLNHRNTDLLLHSFCCYDWSDNK